MHCTRHITVSVRRLRACAVCVIGLLYQFNVAECTTVVS